MLELDLDFFVPTVRLMVLFFFWEESEVFGALPLSEV